MKDHLTADKLGDADDKDDEDDDGEDDEDDEVAYSLMGRWTTRLQTEIR